MADNDMYPDHVTRRNRNLVTTSIVISLVVGLILGALAGYFLRDNQVKNDSTNTNNQASNTGATEPKTDSLAADLRVVLNSLGLKHVDYSLDAIKAVADGNSQQLTLAQNNLSSNGTDISNIINTYYGSDNQKKFIDMWNSHNATYVSYTQALKNKDDNAKNKAISDLDNEAKDMSDFFTGLNSNLSNTDLKNIISSHAGLVRAAADAYVAGNLTDFNSRKLDAEKQIATLGDTLSAAIVKQYPDKF